MTLLAAAFRTQKLLNGSERKEAENGGDALDT